MNDRSHPEYDEPTKVKCKFGKAPWCVKNKRVVAKIQVNSKHQYKTVKVKVQQDQLVLEFTNHTLSTTRLWVGQGVYVVCRDQLLHLHE